jgi:GH24 family phage-related lysozyme (muramidase)
MGATAMLKEFEGYRANPYWDVNAHRVGYGSDTITDLATGQVRKVQPGDRVTPEMADADLNRRVPEFQQGITKHVPQFAALPDNVKTGITSLAYNYGADAKALRPVYAALNSGDIGGAAKAVQGLSHHNGGINASRRAKEAQVIGYGGGGSVTGGAQPQQQPQQVAQAGGAMPRPQPNRAAMLRALSDENLPPQIAAVLMQHMKPSEYGFQMTPDGTLLRTDARGGSVAPIYQSGSKPSFHTVETSDGGKVSGFADAGKGTFKQVEVGGGSTPANPHAMPGKTTEDERKVSGYANRTVDAHNTINALEQVGTGVLEHIASQVPVVGNMAISKEKQNLLQAQRNFINAVLRRESGAVISDAEFDNGTKQYFPQPGDSPEVIAQKRRNREETIEGLMGGAGRNYKPPATYKRSTEQAPAQQKPAAQAAPAKPASKMDYDKLPSGTQFLDPYGKLRVKP